MKLGGRRLLWDSEPNLGGAESGGTRNSACSGRESLLHVSGARMGSRFMGPKALFSRLIFLMKVMSHKHARPPSLVCLPLRGFRHVKTRPLCPADLTPTSYVSSAGSWGRSQVPHRGIQLGPWLLEPGARSLALASNGLVGICGLWGRGV